MGEKTYHAVGRNLTILGKENDGNDNTGIDNKVIEAIINICKSLKPGKSRLFLWC